MHEHRNIKNRKFCPTCDHSHFPHEDVNLAGLCLKDPPTPFLVGMQPPAIQGAQAMPVLRSWYSNVGRNDTCSHHTPRIMGEG